MRAMLPSPRPEQQPVTFNRQIEEDDQALIEKPFDDEESSDELDKTPEEQEEEAELVSAVQERMDARRDTPVFRYLATALLLLLAALLIFGAYFMCQAKPAAEQHAQGFLFQRQATAETVADQSVLARAFRIRDFSRPTKNPPFGRLPVAPWRADPFRTTSAVPLST
jgi:hypothetical protein